MSDLPTAHSPIAIDRVERARGDGDAVRLRITGHRFAVASEAELDALLIVRLHGRRHRFAASNGGTDDPSPGSWEANFTVPDWAVPVEYGQAALWVGEAAVALPPVGTRIRMPEPAPASPVPELAVSAPVDAAALAAATAEAGRAGPLADALLRETVAALHAELEQRSNREATLDGALERARAELVARTASQAELEATHGELRTELGRLVEAVAEQQGEFERRLKEARTRSEAELAQARSESDEARAELARARDDGERARAELNRARDDGERARTELAQARGDAERARSELAQGRAEADHARAELAATSISRDAAIAEAGGLRAELSRLGSELVVAQEQSAAGSGELGVAQQLLQDARALTAQLRGEGGV